MNFALESLEISSHIIGCSLRLEGQNEKTDLLPVRQMYRNYALQSSQRWQDYMRMLQRRGVSHPSQAYFLRDGTFLQRATRLKA